MQAFETSYTYTPAMTRQAYLAFLWRTNVVFLVLTLALFAFGVFWFQNVEYGTLSGLCLGVVLVYWSGWVRAFRQSSASAAEGGNPQVVFSFNEEGMAASTSIVTTTVKWAGIDRVVRTRKFIFILRKGITHPMPIPVKELPEEAANALLSWVRQSGGKVR